MNLHFLQFRLFKRVFLSTVFILMFNPDAFSQFINTNLLTSQSDPSIYFNHNYSGDKKEYKAKDPRIAFILSSSTTLFAVLAGRHQINNGSTYNDEKEGIKLIALGILLGPSVGNLYAHNLESVRKGIMTRFTGGLLAFSGLYIGLIDYLVLQWERGIEIEALRPIAYTLLFTGTAVVIYSTIYDFINAPKNVKKYNKAKQKKLSLSPAYNPIYNSVGLSMNLHF